MTEQKRGRAIFAVCLGMMVLAAGCTDQEPQRVATEEASPSASATPGPARTVQGELPLGRVKLSKVRRAAAADGRIDRYEAVRLATHKQPRPLGRVAARRRGDVWSVRVVDADGCRSVLRLDATTGMNRGGSLACQ